MANWSDYTLHSLGGDTQRHDPICRNAEDGGPHEIRLEWVLDRVAGRRSPCLADASDRRDLQDA